MKQQASEDVLFYSYDPSDQTLYEQLTQVLRPLVREARLSEWSAYQTLPGADVAGERKQALDNATYVLLLLSAAYLASDPCYQEMLEVLERQQQGTLHIIAILLRPCDWSATPLTRVHCLPRNGQAVTSWERPEQAFFVITQEMRHIIGLSPLLPSFPAQEGQEQRNRRSLLRQVQHIWIEGVLERSLHQEARLDLHLQDQPDALQNPWQFQIQESQREPRSFPEGVTIVQVYDDAGGELLILGEPGAGKTTLLLELARTLLHRAELDATHPLPVFLHLSSWARKRQPFAEWVIAELASKYHIPRRVGKRWVENRRILLLLDGLDEVRDTRDACVRAILDYHDSKTAESKAPLVICCRSQEYATLSTRLPLSRAVEILPLTQEQIDQYFQQAGSQLEALHEALQRDTELAHFAHQPLGLTLLTLAYQQATKEEFPPSHASPEDILRAVFASYLDYMLARHKQVRTGFHQWLMYLARQMYGWNQNIFHVEELHPGWFPEKGKDHSQGISKGFLAISIRTHFYVISAVLTGLIFGSGLGLIFGVLMGLGFGPLVGLQDGVLAGLFAGLLIGRACNQECLEEIAGTVSWSWATIGYLFATSLGTGLGAVLIVLVVSIVALAQGTKLSAMDIPATPLRYVLFWSFAGLALGVGTLFRDREEKPIIQVPNGGIWRSGTKGLIIWLAPTLLFICVFELLWGTTTPSSIASPLQVQMIILSDGLGFGTLVAILFGFRKGLGTFLLHFQLRFWLWRSGMLPWKLIAFLDEAEEHLLLRRIGGGYTFAHPLLLEYLASLENPMPEGVAPSDPSVEQSSAT